MTVYRAAATDALVIVPLDELTAVYHRPAAATHLLIEPAPEILRALAEGEADAATLLARLADRYDLDADAGEGIVARLDELVAAGLVAAA